MIFTETRGNESSDVLIVETTALFDQCLRQSRQRGELAVLRRATLANGLNVRRLEPLLERQRSVECDRRGANVGYRVGEQQRLDLRFGKAAAVDVLEQADKAVDQNRGVDMAPAIFGSMPKADCNSLLKVQVRSRSY